METITDFNLKKNLKLFIPFLSQYTEYLIALKATFKKLRTNY